MGTVIAVARQPIYPPWFRQYSRDPWILRRFVIYVAGVRMRGYVRSGRDRVLRLL